MDDGDHSLRQPTPRRDDSVVLAQPAANPAASDSPAMIVDVEGHRTDDKNADVPAP